MSTNMNEKSITLTHDSKCTEKKPVDGNYTKNYFYYLFAKNKLRI